MKKPMPAARLAVSDLNIRKSAVRLLGQALVSTEVHYVQRELGTTATQQQIDEKVVAVRRLPWTSIVQPD
ncbi:MAG TPA: hypothetical protein VFT12_12625 [Thermoanaerobaculia bacterium]|nr:hypothetical protein [Thermoanaerobaculia bacterium]